MRKKFTLKLIFLTPFVALLLSTSIYFIENYPQSYTDVTGFIDKKVIKINRFFQEKEPPPPPLIIDEDELLSRLEKRMKKANIVEAMTQKVALEVLASTVRVTSEGSVGTGVIIYSEKIDSIYHSYIVTNSHVIKNKDEVEIETFTYLKKQTISSTTTYPGRVISNDSTLDLALIQVITPDVIGKQAIFDTINLVTNITLYQPVYVSGCSLAKPPLVTDGHVAHISAISSVITAFSIFGNSGGGVYTAEGALVGIVRGVSTLQVPPRGIRIPEPNLTHMIPGPLVRSWLVVAGLSFVFDSDSLLTHHDFLKDQKALILEQQEKKSKKEVKNKSKK